MAMCVMAVVGAAPCQCFSPGAIHTISPGRISSIGPPQRCARPQPAVTMSVWPSGCVCHAVRAPGSNVTLAPATSAASGARNSGLMRTVPVNQSDGPFSDGCEPTLLISIVGTPVGYAKVARNSTRVSQSATAQFRQVFRVARAFQLDLRGSAIDLAEIVRCEFNRGTSKVLFQSMQLGCSRDRNHPWLLGKNPRQRDRQLIQPWLRSRNASPALRIMSATSRSGRFMLAVLALPVREA